MADLKKLISLENLTSYDSLIKAVISDGDATVNAKSIKTVLVDGDNIKFFRKEAATLEDTADYTVAISSSDVDNLKKILKGFTTEGSVKDAIDANTTAIEDEAKRADEAEKANAAAIQAEAERADAAEKANAAAIAAEKTRAEAAESDLDTAVKAAQKTADDITTLVGTIPATSEAETVTAFVTEQVAKAAGDAKKVADDLAAYEESNDARVETAEDDIDALEGRATALETAVGTVANLDTTSKEVVGAINELVEAISDAEAAGEVTISTSTTTEGMLKSYTFTQNNKTIGTVDIPKDYLVKSAQLKTVETEDQPYEGAKVGDKYIDFVINTKDATATDEHLYIPVNDLFDSYTSGSQPTDKVVITVDNTANTISASVTAGAITATELAADAVVTAKVADKNITKAKLSDDVQATLDKADAAEQAIEDAIDALDKTVTQTAGADGVSAEVVEEDGLLKSVTVSIAANTYDSYGSAAAVKTEFDPYKYDVATATDITKMFSDEE